MQGSECQNWPDWRLPWQLCQGVRWQTGEFWHQAIHEVVNSVVILKIAAMGKTKVSDVKYEQAKLSHRFIDQFDLV